MPTSAVARAGWIAALVRGTPHPPKLHQTVLFQFATDTRVLEKGRLQALRWPLLAQSDSIRRPSAPGGHVGFGTGHGLPQNEDFGPAQEGCQPRASLLCFMGPCHVHWSAQLATSRGCPTAPCHVACGGNPVSYSIYPQLHQQREAASEFSMILHRACARWLWTRASHDDEAERCGITLVGVKAPEKACGRSTASTPGPAGAPAHGDYEAERIVFLGYLQAFILHR